MNAEQEPNLQTQVFEYIKESAGKIGAFVEKEAPPFISEFLSWKFWEAGFYAGIWLFFFILCPLIMYFWAKKRKVQLEKSANNDQNEVISYCLCLFIMLAAIGTSFFCSFVPNVSTMIQIHIAPKFYIFETCAEEWLRK